MPSQRARERREKDCTHLDPVFAIINAIAFRVSSAVEMDNASLWAPLKMHALCIARETAHEMLQH